MKNRLMTLALVISGTFTGLMAQEYSFRPAGNEVVFNDVDNLTIKAATGNEVTVSQEKKGSIPERAQGLRPVGAVGVQDNTGVGLSVSEKDGASHVVQVLRNGGNFTVMVPSNVKIHITHSTNQAGKLSVEGFKGELTAELKYQKIHLKDVTGPLLINAIYGDVDVMYSQLSNSPSSIVSVYGAVDVAVPANAGADLRLKTSHGDIFTDIEIDFDETEGPKSLTSKDLSGKINGGGVKIHLEARYGNIYLRKR